MFQRSSAALADAVVLLAVVGCLLASCVSLSASRTGICGGPSKMRPASTPSKCRWHEDRDHRRHRRELPSEPASLLLQRFQRRPDARPDRLTPLERPDRVVERAPRRAAASRRATLSI